MPQTGRGRFYELAEAQVGGNLASAARGVGTAQGTAFDVGDARHIVAELNITAIGTGNVTASLEESVDGVAWDQVAAWPNKNANGVHKKSFRVTPGTRLRWAWTVATATVTFEIRNVVGRR